MQDNMPEHSGQQSRQAINQPANRRGFFRQALVAAASLIGAGALLEESSGSALASGPGSFSSSVSTTPAVKATGTKGAKGVVASSDTNTGVSGTSSSGPGLYAQSSSGLGAHVIGGGASPTTPAFKEAAIFAEGGPGYGLYTANASNGNAAIYATNSSGDAIHAVNNTSGTSGLFTEGGPGYGVYATSTSGTSISAVSNSGTGLYGSGSTGVYGSTNSGTGLYGNSNTGTSLYTQSTSGLGAHIVGGGATATTPSFKEVAIFAEGGPSYGLYATSSGSTGVYAQSANQIGVHAVGGGASQTSGPPQAAVFAEGGPSYALYATNNSSTDTVFVQNGDTSGHYTGLHAVAAGVTPSSSPNLTAIFAEGGSANGVTVGSNGGTGIYSNDRTSGTGVVGLSNSGLGVYGGGGGGIGVHGTGATGILGEGANFAGDFNGNVHVGGTLTKGGGSFKIDHPLDPAHKYLSHSFVESPDMKNIYDGVVTLDAKGQAEIMLPEWFGTLNSDYRYQLTAIGVSAPELYIANKLQSNRFTIAGGKPGMEVSWQVTGIRQDPWANAHRIPVEQDKLAKEQGYYLHPDIYGEPEEKGIYQVRYPHTKQPVYGST